MRRAINIVRNVLLLVVICYLAASYFYFKGILDPEYFGPAGWVWGTFYTNASTLTRVLFLGGFGALILWFLYDYFKLMSAEDEPSKTRLK